MGLVEIDLMAEDPGTEHQDSEAGLLDSAFASMSEGGLRIVPGSVVGTVVEQGMDVIACVHDGIAKKSVDARGRHRDGSQQAKTKIVEVVKDKMGAKFGEWCIWVL